MYIYSCNYTITYFVDCYMNTIGDMRIEMDFYGHCKKLENILYFLKISEKLTMYCWYTKF